MGEGRSLKLILVAVLLCTHLFSRTALGQEKKEPPPRPAPVGEKEDLAPTREARLPKIELPEFVITGRELIEPPVASKGRTSDSDQSVDAARLTVLGEKMNDSLAALAQKSGANLARSAQSYDGKLNLAYGRFTSLYGEGWFGKKYREADFDLHARYLSRKAYIPQSEAASGKVDATGGLYLPERLRFFGGSRVYGDASYQEESFHFFGSFLPQLKRTQSNTLVGLGLFSGPKAPFLYESSVRFRRLIVRDQDRSTEDNLLVAIRALGEKSSWQPQLEFLYAADYLQQSVAGHDPHYLRTTAGFKKLFFDKLDVSGKVGVYYYKNSDSGFRSKIYPHLGLQYYVDRELTLFARFEPSIQQNSLSKLLIENRYLGNDVSVRHSDLFVNFSGGGQFNLANRGTGRVYVSYQRIHDFPLYNDPSVYFYPDVSPLPFVNWSVVYGGTTRITSLTGEILLDLTTNDRVTGTATMLSSHNSDTGEQVPYLPPIQVSSSYLHQFPFGLSMQVSARFVGRRPFDLYSSSRKLDSYFLLGANIEYRVVKNFILFLQLNNIFDERYSVWNRYQEVPFTALGGFSVKW
jgi:hypothetical protein